MVKKKATPKKTAKKPVAKEATAKPVVEKVETVVEVAPVAKKEPVPAHKVRKYQSHLDYIQGIKLNSMSTKKYAAVVSGRGVPGIGFCEDKNSVLKKAIAHFTEKIGG